MEQIINLSLPPYLAEFITHSFGSPAVIPKTLPEYRIIRELLIPTPSTPMHEKPAPGEVNVRIIIPSYPGEVGKYIYIPVSGKNILRNHLAGLFRKSAWVYVSDFARANCPLRDVIFHFMQQNGIDDAHWDSISKIFYRTRQQYFRMKIKI